MFTVFVSIKAFSIHISSSPDLERRFDREARAITGLPRRAAEVYTLFPIAKEALIITPLAWTGVSEVGGQAVETRPQG